MEKVPTLAQLTAVLAATNLNPSIFNLLWLVREEIIKESEILPDSVYTPLAVNVPTGEFLFTVVPERVQIRFADPSVSQCNYVEVLQSTLGRIATKLPHTPFSAIGFNMSWILEYGATSESRERDVFLSNKNPLAKFFTEEDCRFGGYLSKMWRQSKVRVEIKPVSSSVGEKKGLNLAFNFHKDLKKDLKPGESAGQIHQFLKLWNSALEEANSIVNELGQELCK